MMGIRIGMPLIQANQLIQHRSQQVDEQHADEEIGPQLNVLPHDPYVDYQDLVALAAKLQSHIAPLVAIEPLEKYPWAGFPRHQPESLLCDVSGVEHLFGGEQGLLEATSKFLSDASLHARIAIAPSVSAAWAMAHFGAAAIEVVDDPATSLGPLPVESLRLDLATVATLDRLGIERVDQLLRLPRGGLATRLGKNVVTRISQAMDEIDEPINVHHDEPEICCSHELEYPTDDREILLHRIEWMMEEIGAGLATRKHGALSLLCRLGLAAHPPLNIVIGLFAPSQDTKHLLSLLSSRFENFRIPSNVVTLMLSIPLTSPLRSVQSGLFDDANDHVCSSHSFGGSSVSRLVDSLSGRLGRDAVLSVESETDSLPENAYSVYPMTGFSAIGSTSIGGKSKSRSRTRPNQKGFRHQNKKEATDDRNESMTINTLPSRDDAMRRPLTIFANPLLLTSLAPPSAQSGDVPSVVRFRNQTFRIVAVWGPERIETGWWKGPSIRRDYYRVETANGRWWWIYRDIATTKTADAHATWMMHGQFT
ncbi:hypothetical protein CA13_21170 [Planctomycetes bacterium CA13]|uniref:DNA polymerase IV n=2 Tax=Novipirellula herctigrandis TaxID=2527986 RepID=A0A5C5Z1I0_9BACT|nr:hypothetical protein CA13_21170 [Planctomycetes bacterium CA13]